MNKLIMENEITKLVIQKKDKQLVNVFLDNKYAFSLNIMTAVNLRRGQKLSDDKVNELKSESEYSTVLNSALYFLSHRARSIKEMETYLSIKKRYSKPVISKVIEKLVKKEYLDDNDFTRMWIENRIKFNPKGARALFYELQNKGINSVIIEKALLKYDDNKAAWSAVQKKIVLWEKLENEKIRKKLYSFLSNRGFDYEIIINIYNKIVEMNSD